MSIFTDKLAYLWQQATFLLAGLHMALTFTWPSHPGHGAFPPLFNAFFQALSWHA